MSSAEREADLDRQVARVVMWASGQRLLLVVDPVGVDDDLVCDVSEILTSLCVRLYGRPAVARVRRGVEAVIGRPV